MISRGLRAAAAIVGALALLAGSAPAQGDWVALRPEGAGFTARFPAVPATSQDVQRTFAGPVRSVEYGWIGDALDLRVERHELPALAEWLLSAETLLDRAEADLLEEERGERVAGRSLRHRGRPARELRYRLAERGLEARALLVLDGRRLYIAAALAPDAGSADAARFLDAFALDPAPGP